MVVPLIALASGRDMSQMALAISSGKMMRPFMCGRLPIPASVYGLLLLAAALKFGVLKLDQVRETGLFLTGIFPLLFVPAAAGVMELGSQLMNLLLPAVLAIVPITALVMAVTGMVAQKCAGGKEHKNG